MTGSGLGIMMDRFFEIDDNDDDDGDDRIEAQSFR